MRVRPLWVLPARPQAPHGHTAAHPRPMPARAAQVIVGKVPYLATWNPKKCIYGALDEIKQLIRRAPRSQPSEDATF